MSLLGPFVLSLSLFTSGQARAFFCFGMDMITATMCIAQKTSAIAIMTKLEHDPRAGTWASEGKPGERFVKREEAAMKAAQACMDLISCTAANAMAWAVAGSIPDPVKGDLGNFPSQIWYGAQLPSPGQSLDKLFDDKDPAPPFYARSTPFFQQQGSSELLAAPGGSRGAGGLAAPGEATSVIGTGLAMGESAIATVGGGRAAPGVASAPQSQTADSAMRYTQSPTAIRFEGGDAALDLSQVPAYSPFGNWGHADADEIVGFMPSGASPPTLFSNNGVREGEWDGYARPAVSGTEMSQVARAGGAIDNAETVVDAPSGKNPPAKDPPQP